VSSPSSTASAASRTALVLGSSGLVGARCVAHLLASTTYRQITCLVRRPQATVEPRSDRLRERVVDFDALTAAEVDAVDDVYSALGSTMKKAGSREAFRRVDFTIPFDVARLAIAKGAKRIALVSSVGADARSSNFYLKTKGELEEALAALSLKALHVFRPSLLVGDRTESRPGEAVATAVGRAAGALLLGGLRKYRPIDVDRIACAMVTSMVRADPEPPLQIYEFAAIMQLST
jgi:uncharacterized protein YbjT (DUF2867 family)